LASPGSPDIIQKEEQKKPGDYWVRDKKKKGGREETFGDGGKTAERGVLLRRRKKGDVSKKGKFGGLSYRKQA